MIRVRSRIRTIHGVGRPALCKSGGSTQSREIVCPGGAKPIDGRPQKPLKKYFSSVKDVACLLAPGRATAISSVRSERQTSFSSLIRSRTRQPN